jgi:hypothetical protein
MISTKKRGFPRLLERDDVVRRVTRALQTMWSLNDGDLAKLRRQTQWPFATIDDLGDLNCQAENKAYLDELKAQAASRFRPSPADHSDMNVALAWFNAIGLAPAERAKAMRAGRIPLTFEQKLIWNSVKGWSVAAIARRLKDDERSVRRKLDRAWDEVDATANASENVRRRLAAAARA